MQIDRTSDIIAHFIGIFDALTDEARLRVQHAEGRVENETALPDNIEAMRGPNFASTLALRDYEPDVDYSGTGVRLLSPPLRPAAPSLAERFSPDEPGELWGTPRAHRPERPDEPEMKDPLPVAEGPGSTIAHVAQVNVMRDDDQFIMPDGEQVRMDMDFVFDHLLDQATGISAYTPFAALTRTDTYEGLRAIADDIQSYARALDENNTTGLDETADVDFVLAAKEIDGVYANGKLVEAAPLLDEALPDRGLAASPQEPESTATDLAQEGGSSDMLTVEAGANLVANVASFVDTGIIAPVMSVMGDYRQIDTINQAFSYSDGDDIAPSLAGTARQDAGTVAMNIAHFQRTSVAKEDQADEETDESADGQDMQAEEEEPLVFPQYWRVSEIQGDVSFVKWIEQYNFVTDNDRIVVTTTGSETTVLTGGDTALNLASFLGIGEAYDLIIVGGDVLDMNVISQIAVFYDDDWLRGDSGLEAAALRTGGNLIWNEASITNVGLNDRFEAMPGYIAAARDNIAARDADMPEGLDTDPGFAGQYVLDVLYITGNLYDVTFVKQVSIVGDADHVTRVASDYITAEGAVASVSIATGGNAVVNIAGIVDYDTFGATTYLAGNLYSDAVLIQGGIIGDDDTEPMAVNDRLANEIIAFLDDDVDAPNSADATLNAGHDLSWSLASPADAMQTVIA